MPVAVYQHHLKACCCIQSAEGSNASAGVRDEQKRALVARATAHSDSIGAAVESERLAVLQVRLCKQKFHVLEMLMEPCSGGHHALLQQNSAASSSDPLRGNALLIGCLRLYINSAWSAAGEACSFSPLKVC